MKLPTMKITFSAGKYICGSIVAISSNISITVYNLAPKVSMITWMSSNLFIRKPLAKINTSIKAGRTAIKGTHINYNTIDCVKISGAVPRLVSGGRFGFVVLGKYSPGNP